MKIDIESLLNRFQAMLAAKVIPALGETYEAGITGVACAAMFFSAQEFERAADTLATDNQEMRDLFAQGCDWITDSALSARLREASVRRETSYRISDLSRNNDALNTLLIEFHTYIEELATPKARAMEGKILRHLKATADRRYLVPLPAPEAPPA